MTEVDSSWDATIIAKPTFRVKPVIGPTPDYTILDFMKLPTSTEYASINQQTKIYNSSVMIEFRVLADDGDKYIEALEKVVSEYALVGGWWSMSRLEPVPGPTRDNGDVLWKYLVTISEVKWGLKWS